MNSLTLSCSLIKSSGGVAHSVERSVRNRQAQGSKPCSSTFFFSFRGWGKKACQLCQCKLHLFGLKDDPKAGSRYVGTFGYNVDLRRVVKTLLPQARHITHVFCSVFGSTELDVTMVFLFLCVFLVIQFLQFFLFGV